jgi:hypothetical protein
MSAKLTHLLTCTAMVCFLSIARTVTADDGWYAPPILESLPATQTVYYPSATVVNYPETGITYDAPASTSVATPITTYYTPNVPVAPTTVYYASAASSCVASAPIYTERHYWVAKPATETTEREEKVIVRKPVVETSQREEKVIVRKPVIETAEHEETRIVYKPVYETAEQEQRVIVNRPVYESAVQTNYITQYTPYVTYMPVRNGWFRWSEVATTNYAPQVVAQQTPVQTVRYVPQEEVRKVPVTTMKYVEEQQTYKVPVTTEKWVEEEQTRTVPVTTIRYEEQEQVRKVPITTVRTEYEQRTELVPAGY